MGGSTGEGITSGLDMPKPDASRQSYQFGKTVDNIRRDMPGLKELYKENMASRGSNFNDFLINMGLDLVSRPKSGNIFSQVAASAREPFAQFQANKSSVADSEDKLNRALIGDLLDRETTLEEARIKNQGGDQDKFAFEKQQDSYTKLIEAQRELEADRRKIEETQKDIQGTMEPDEIGINEDIRKIEEKLKDNAKLQSLYKDVEEDAVRAAILKGISNGIFTFEDLITYDETGVPPREDNADGGRIGYQQGNMVQPAAPMMPASLPTDQGPAVSQGDSPVQDLSFEELRSRLPESITNDVVTLIANSQQALVEFANIQTEQDVKAFNRKYEVNLVLPQGA
jgi:hypothetical protein